MILVFEFCLNIKIIRKACCMFLKFLSFIFDETCHIAINTSMLKNVHLSCPLLVTKNIKNDKFVIGNRNKVKYEGNKQLFIFHVFVAIEFKYSMDNFEYQISNKMCIEPICI